MYVPLLVLTSLAVARILNPLDVKSIHVCVVSSAEERFGQSLALTTLYGAMEESLTLQFSIALEDLIKTHLGLKPVYTKGPSVDPLPVYDPNALNPFTAAQQ